MKKLVLICLLTSLSFGGFFDTPKKPMQNNAIGDSDIYCWSNYVFIKSSGYSDSVIQVFKEENGKSVPMKCTDIKSK